MDGGRTAGRNGGGLAPWQADLAARLLTEDISTDVPIAQLAAACGLSRSYFTRAFKVSMGMTPHRWLMRQRVRRAESMLDHGSESISAIAHACGFADQSHLTRTFHAMIGHSPAAWRRRHRADGGGAREDVAVLDAPAPDVAPACPFNPA